MVLLTELSRGWDFSVKFIYEVGELLWVIFALLPSFSESLLVQKIKVLSIKFDRHSANIVDLELR